MRFLKVVAFIFMFVADLHSGVRSAVDSIKVITVRSEQQKIIDQDRVLLTGDVEILLDYKVHIWADIVEMDKTKQVIVARANTNSFVKIENPDLLMLAEYVELKLNTKTGYARNIKIHVKDGFISSDKAEKIDDQTWEMKHLKYTSCDCPTPHWAFTAHKASLYKNSILNASGLLFKIYDTPIFAFPGLIFPLQNRAGSGFLIPKLSFDASLGFGIRQDYYWLMGEHCDTTIGFNFVQRKGFVFSDEFRWASSPENFIVVNSNYAEEWNAFLEKKKKITESKYRHYWVQGKYFQPLLLGDISLQTLIRFDFGTDKRIGYHFLNDVERVEDSFYNTFIERYSDQQHTTQFMVHSERSQRKQFTDFVDKCVQTKKDCEEKVSITYLPRYEWGTKYNNLLPFLSYRHDLVIDQAFLTSRDIEKIYKNDVLERVFKTEPSFNANTARFMYRGTFLARAQLAEQQLSLAVHPNVQLRSNVKNTRDCARSKVFPELVAEWAFPERMTYSDDYEYMHFIHPILRWTFLPKFYYNHWYYIDKFDRPYSDNRIELIVRNNWQLRDCNIDLLLTQGFEGYKRKEIFPLMRDYNQKHLLPFNFYAECECRGLTASISQEYSWKTLSLLQSEILTQFEWNRYQFFLGYIYQKESLQKDRELLSDIPAFALIGATVSLGKQVKLHYDGSFYSRSKHVFPMFDTMKPMLHRIRFEYTGHCWGLSLGWEEKRYREYGRWKSERAVTLALNLESVGSIAQKFKQPTIMRAPWSYKG